MLTLPIQLGSNYLRSKLVQTFNMFELVQIVFEQFRCSRVFGLAYL